jgi:hypothetical protein
MRIPSIKHGEFESKSKVLKLNGMHLWSQLLYLGSIQTTMDDDFWKGITKDLFCLHDCKHVGSVHAFQFSNSEVLLYMPTLALRVISKSHSEARLVHGFARWCKAEVLH